MKYFIFLLCFFPFQLFAQTSYVAPAQLLKVGSYELKGEGSLWNSASRFDVDGEEVPYENGQGFSVLEGEFIGKYGATKELQLSFGANFRQNIATVDSPSNPGTTESITSTGIQAITTTLTYAFEPVDRLLYAVEGFYTYHPYTNSRWDGTDITESLALGDDGGAYGFGLMATYAHPKKNYLSFKGYYRRPGQELSPEFAWDVQAALAWNYVALVARLEGIYSMGQDAYSEDPAGKPAINTGGSALYNSIDRQYLAPYAGMNIALGKKWRLEGRYQVISSARSYDTGSLIAVALAYRNEPDTRDSIDKAFKEYDVEATVIKLSPKKQFVILDKGLAHNVQKGQRFDLYHFDFVGGNVLLARGVIIQVNADQSVLKITSRFSVKHEIKEGTVARGMGK